MTKYFSSFEPSFVRSHVGPNTQKNKKLNVLSLGEKRRKTTVFVECSFSLPGMEQDKRLERWYFICKARKKIRHYIGLN